MQVLFVVNIKELNNPVGSMFENHLNCKKYKFENDQHMCYYSFLIKIYLIKYLKIDFKEIFIKKTIYNKPYIEVKLKNTNNIDIIKFNISHDYPYLTLYFNNNQEVGVDLININRNINILSITNVLHPFEKDYIDKNKNNQKYYFFKMWTLKEAYFKLKGIGLNDIDMLKEIGIYPKVLNNDKLTISSPCLIEKLDCNVCQIDLKNKYNISLASYNSINLKETEIVFLNSQELNVDNLNYLLLQTNINY